MSDHVVAEDEIHERIAALLVREQQYRCVDYVSPPPKASNNNRRSSSSAALVENLQSSDLVHLLEECASLVTDTSYFSKQPATPEKDAKDEEESFPKSPSSVSLRGVNEVPHGESAVHGENHGGRIQQPPEQDFSYWRQQMFDWAGMVADGFEMDREVVAIAFNILDRYIPTELARTDCPAISRDDFQLFAMTALYTAVKIMEPYPRKIGVEALVSMSRDFYSTQDIVLTERDMLRILQWQVNPPTAICFCRLFAAYLKEGPPSKDVETMCTTITQVAVADTFFLSYKASTIGLASLLHAARLTGRSDAESKALLHDLQSVFLSDEERKELEIVYARLEKLYC